MVIVRVTKNIYLKNYVFFKIQILILIFLSIVIFDPNSILLRCKDLKNQYFVTVS